MSALDRELPIHRTQRGVERFDRSVLSIREEGREKKLSSSIARNPLKSLDSDERIQGNPRKTKPPIQRKPSGSAHDRSKTKEFQITGLAMGA
jgi:hypothetical protein